MKKYIIEILPCMWWSPGYSDGTTCMKRKAKKYTSEHGAKVARGVANSRYGYATAKIVPVES